MFADFGDGFGSTSNNGGGLAGFVPHDFSFGRENEASILNGGVAPSLYAPFQAGTAETHRRTCLPLKISMIYRAYNQNPHATKVVLNGEEVAEFKLVGMVKNFQSIQDAGADKFAFDLDDGTGRIKVEKLTGVRSTSNSVWLQNELEEFSNRAASSPPIYIKVWGETNLRGVHEPRVKASAILDVENVYEIFKHDMDVALYHLTANANNPNKPAHLKTALTPSPKTSPVRAPPPRPLDPSTPSDSSLPPTVPRNNNRESLAPNDTDMGDAFAPGLVRSSLPRTSVVQTPAARQQPAVKSEQLKDTIQKYLLSKKDSHPQGIHVRFIAKFCETTSDTAKKHLETLEREGLAFPTVGREMWLAFGDED